jgi:hypothetical protein
MSLLGTGVAIFVDVLNLGIELALVVSFRQEDSVGLGETFDRGEDAGAAAGEDFWKKE